MRVKVCVAAALAGLALQAQALSLSTFTDNGGVHEAAEFASALVLGSTLDKYSFSLDAPGTLTASASVLGKLTGLVKLFKEAGAVDPELGGLSLVSGSATFTALASGDYYYLVSGKGTGGYLLESALSPVPEPETIALILAGLGVTVMLQRRRRQF